MRLFVWRLVWGLAATLWEQVAGTKGRGQGEKGKGKRVVGWGDRGLIDGREIIMKSKGL